MCAHVRPLAAGVLDQCSVPAGASEGEDRHGRREPWPLAIIAGPVVVRLCLLAGGGANTRTR